MPLPKVVSESEWQAARDKLLAKGKAATRLLDDLAAERRRLPMVRIERDYVFDGSDGKARLIDLFERRRQLILYHFMFGPGAEGWPTAGCPGCSWVAHHIGNLAHLHARDTSFVMVSLAPLESIRRYQQRMGWTMPWYSSAGGNFNKDFGRTRSDGEMFGLSVFIRDDAGNVYRTYFTERRGVETLGSTFTFLDLTPYGRQWEKSPQSWPQGEPYVWWRRHDEYEQGDRPPSR
jgi:predicted dithiol-disulfide oxidoreductase (DUF899 family)